MSHYYLSPELDIEIVTEIIFLLPSGGDDTAAINAAIIKGQPLGVGTFLVFGVINGIPVCPLGPAYTKLLSMSINARIQNGPNLGVLPTADNGKYGSFVFDGNGLSTGPLLLLNTSGTILDVPVLINGLGDGLVIAGQNCKVDSPQIAAMSGCGIVYDNGAGNNKIFKPQVSRCARYHHESRQTLAPPAGAYAVPTLNTVYDPQYEHGSGANLGNYHQLAGNFNFFVNTNFFTPLDVSLVLLEPNTVPGRSLDPNGRLYFLGTCNFSCDASGTKGVAIEANAVSGGVAGALNSDIAVVFAGERVFSGFNIAQKWGCINPIWSQAPITKYNVTTEYQTNGTGAFPAVLNTGLSGESFPDDISVTRNVFVGGYLQLSSPTAPAGGFALQRSRITRRDTSLAGDGSREEATAWFPSGATRAVGRIDLPGIDELGGVAPQNGVIAAGDAALSATSVAGGTGVLTYTLAAAATFLWVKKASGLIGPMPFAGIAGGTLAPAALPAAGQFRGYGIEISADGSVSLSTGGTDQATQVLALANINTLAPAGKLRVADIVILNTAGVFSLSTTRDRRPWARGYYNRVRRLTDITLAAASAMQVIDAANLQVRAETVTGLLRCTLRAWFRNAVVNGNMDLALFVDGLQQGDVECYRLSDATVNTNTLALVSWDVTTPLAAGSHLIAPAWASPNGAGANNTLFGNTAPAQGISFTVEEIPIQNANNGTV